MSYGPSEFFEDAERLLVDAGYRFLDEDGTTAGETVAWTLNGQLPEDAATRFDLASGIAYVADALEHYFQQKGPAQLPATNAGEL